MDKNLIYYNEEFYQMHEPWQKDYFLISEWINKNLEGDIFGDIGCGNGYLIRNLFKNNGKKVWGVDGSKDFQKFVDPSISKFVKIEDLTQDIILPKADVAICLEVAEHIAFEYSDTLVDNITSTNAKTIMFTAAPPGQEGINHINLQPPKFWIDKFKDRGYLFDWEVSADFKKKLDRKLVNTPWYLDNMMVFKRSSDVLKKKKLIMTLLVRDEEDVIRKNIDFHLKQGVDYIIATDNGSIDGTVEILKEYERKGLLHFIEEKEQNYAQAEWVNRMGRIALEKYKADIIFHCDADEFWFARSGNLKLDISGSENDFLYVPLINVLLEEKGGRETFPDDTEYAVVNPLISKNDFEDSKHTNLYYFAYRPKVIFKTGKGLLEVIQGNHDIVQEGKELKFRISQDISIFHYPVRSKRHFFQKIINGGKSYEANKKLNKIIGFQWRRWYESYKKGRLIEEYKRLIINADQKKKLSDQGIIEYCKFDSLHFKTNQAIYNLYVRERKLRHRVLSFLADKTTQKEIIRGKNRQINKIKEVVDQKDREIEKIKDEANFIKSSKFWILRNRYVKMKSFRPKHLKEMAKKAHSVFQREGAKSFLRHMYKYSIHGRDYFKPEKREVSEYDAWIYENEKWDRKNIEKEIRRFEYKPKISIITPVYNVNPKWLKKCIQSVVDQYYGNWELCLYDDASTKLGTKRCLKSWEDSDPRIKITFGKKNQHISGASNEAIKMATGEFVALLDNDDELSPDALFENVKVLNKYPETDFIYSDEDKIDIKGDRSNPFFKPNWSPDLFHSVNYICHLSVIRKSIGDKIGWFRKGYEGAQDFDLFLRVLDETQKIRHIPKILYHWRMLETSTARDTKSKSYAHQAGRQALVDYIDENSLKAKVFDGFGDTNHHLAYDVPDGALVSIIIPFKDKIAYLRKCVDSILKKTSYRNYEIILVSNNSQDQETFEYMQEIRNQSNIKVFERNIPFNFSALNNWAAQKAQGDFLLFLNNDTEVISPVWLEEMLGHAARPDVGAVGAKLLFPDGRIQHSGVILGMGGLADHLFSGQYADETYYALANFARNYLAVTAACLAISKKKFWEVGGFNEKFTVCGNDVDLCLKLYEKGYLNVYTPRAELFHFESLSRDKNPPQCDIDISLKRYAPYLNWKDPYFNKNLALDAKDARLNISPDSREKISPKEMTREESTEEKYQKKRFEEQKNIIAAVDLSEKELSRHFEIVNSSGIPREVKTMNWLLPNYSHVLFGGIYTILRFASYFQHKKGIKNRIIIFDNPSKENVESKRVEAVKEFPALKDAEFSAMEKASDLPSADAVVSTFWPSCYISARFNKTKKKFYFIQDYEPLFYSAGSMYAMAEATYRMGFKGILNTPGLAEYVRQQHKMDCQEFFPCVNEKIYHIDEESLRKKLDKKTLDVFVYGRPNHDRNAFELALLTLTKLKEKYEDKINIISAGDHWREEDFGVKGVIRNLGRLESLNAVADLYRKCDIGLVFMFTKHPSYQPFEFMACGCATVTNFNGANTWFLKDGENAMVSEPEPSCLVDKISKLIEDKELRRKIVKNGLKEIKKHNWNDECEKIFEYIQK